MIKVLRCLCVGLLLCGVTAPVASKAEYSMSDFMGFGAIAFVLKEHGINALTMGWNMTCGLGSGLKTGLDYTVIPTGTYAKDNPRLSGGFACLALGMRGMYDEIVNKNEKTRSPVAFVLNGTVSFVGIMLAATHFDLLGMTFNVTDSLKGYLNNLSKPVPPKKNK